MSKIFIRNTAFGALMLAIFCVTGCKSNGTTESKSLYITSETSYDELCDAIFEAQGYNYFERIFFDLYANHLDLDRRYKVGHYRIGGNLGIIETVRMFALGIQTPVNIVVSEARTIPQLAGKLSRQIEADSLSLVATFNNKALRKELGYVQDSLIAMIIPNTYEVYWTITPEQFLRRMKRENEAFWTPSRQQKLAATGLTRYEAMTLAAIVYEETKVRDEMPKIAGVYMNRLRKGMPLQACPTVKYAMGDFELRRILHKHLRYKSPFNTYINKGLPPAPICIPSIAAIDAVLNYERSGYLFFCARPEFDGKHNFARTLREHNANARRYAKALEGAK